jgi:hypothetical protein
LSYSLNDKLALNLSYEMEVDHMYGRPTWDLTSYQNDLQPGVIWKITPRIMVNPFVQLFTSGKISWDNSAYGAAINAKML